MTAPDTLADAPPPGFRLSVVVPVYNEADTIAQVVERVRRVGLPVEIILVDDGSRDGSRDVLAQLAEADDVVAIWHEHNRGKGAAVRTGLAAATGNVVVIQDADLEYDPQDFRLLLAPILEDRADVVYGNRFHRGAGPVSSRVHRWGNRAITQLSNLRTGLGLSDVETCYKMMRTELVRRVLPQLRENRFGIEIELTARLARLGGVRFHEAPIRYEARSWAEGKKIGWRDGFDALRCIVRY